jgi:hypothetical protein
MTTEEQQHEVIIECRTQNCGARQTFRGTAIGLIYQQIADTGWRVSETNRYYCPRCVEEILVYRGKLP